MPAYPEVNARTIADVITVNNSQEQKWVMNVLLETRGKHPFKALMSGYKGGRPFIEVMDTRRLAGDTINITTEAPLGGDGVQGDNTRSGNEEKGRHNVYQFVIGTKWHGTAATKVARSQSVIGSKFDLNASKKLGEWLAWQQGWDIEMELVVKSHGRNTVRPNYKLTRDSLGTADYLSGETVVRAGTLLGTNQGTPLITAKSNAGADIEKFLLVSPNFALKEWKSSPTFQNLLSAADKRGSENIIFAGGLPDYLGHLIWEWNVKIGSQFGPVGAVCVPLAVLGTAITAADTAQDITGGGSNEGSLLTDRKYFKAFSAAAYVGFEGTKRAATVGTDRFVMIQNLTGADVGKFGFYRYRVNDGNKLTMLERLRAADGGIANDTLTGSSISWATGPWAGLVTDAHPVGSLIYEVNAKGVPIAYSYMLADEAVMTGYGSFDDKLAMGNRTEEKQDHGRLYAVGIECVWGSKAIPRTDGLVNGYVLIESGFKVDGMPDID